MKRSTKKQTRPKIPPEDRKTCLVCVLVEENMKLYLDELSSIHALPISALVRRILWDVVPDMVKAVREEEEQ